MLAKLKREVFIRFFSDWFILVSKALLSIVSPGEKVNSLVMMKGFVVLFPSMEMIPTIIFSVVSGRKVDGLSVLRRMQ
mgnify:CR=1 FL=1